MRASKRGSACSFPLVGPLGLSLALALFPLGSCNSDLEGDGEGDGGGNGGGKDACVGIECQVTSCPMGQRTTLTGVVNIPAGNLPLFNALVYVPRDQVAPLVSGASCDRCDEIPSGNPVTRANTDIRGKFSLVNVPAGKNIPLVIKAGKWRRQVVIPEVAPCKETALDPNLTRLPRNREEGDIPRIALSTGGADAMECLLRKLGIEDKEFTTDAGKGRVHLYGGNGGTNSFSPMLNGGASFTSSKAEPAASWWDKPENLLQYDITVLSCEGAQNLPYKSTSARGNLQTYINKGGRVFASHWHNAWLQHAPMPLSSVATWGNSDSFASITGIIDAPMNSPDDKRNALADWMMAVGGSTKRGEFRIDNAKNTVRTIDARLTERWVYYKPNNNTTIPQYFQFNAPVGADPRNQCGRMVFSDIHVSGSSNGDTSSPGKPFPSGCITKDLTPQEKALIFMIFDLSNCLSPILG